MGSLVFGNLNLGIGPYKFIETKYDLQSKSCHIRRSRTAGVMKKLVQLSIEGRIISRQCDVNSVDTSNHAFEYSYKVLMDQLYPEEPDKRTGDLVCDTVYERMLRCGVLRDVHN